MKHLQFLLAGLVVALTVIGLRWFAMSYSDTHRDYHQVEEVKTAKADVEVYIKTFQSLCLSCHNAAEDHSLQEKGFAPPMWGVRDHYLDHYPEKQDFIDAMVQWVRNPNPQVSHMKGAIKRFGLMAPLALPEDQLEAIAGLIYDGDLVEEPSWWEEHVREQHGG